MTAADATPPPPGPSTVGLDYLDADIEVPS